METSHITLNQNAHLGNSEGPRTNMIPTHVADISTLSVAEKVIYTAVDSIISINETGIILSFNPSAERMLGYSSQEIIGKNVRSLMPSPFRDEHDSYLSNYLNTGIAKIIGTGREVVVLRKDGTEFPADLAISEICHDGNRIFTGVLRDLTEKKENEKQLSDNVAKLSAFLETAVDSIISIDEFGTILSFNPSAERVLGYSSQEIIGKNVRSLMPSPFREQHDGYLSNYLDTGIAKIIGTGREVVVLRKDGTEFPADLAISEIRHDGNRIFTGVLRDLTEKKKWESKSLHSQKLESLGILAGGIAHDFNNLLMGVLGNSSLILEKLSPGSPINSSMKDIQDAATSAAELCQQLLAYAGKGRFVSQALSLSEVVRDFEHLLETTIPKNVALKYKLAESLPAINADPRQLQQLVMNLITNAAEAIGDDDGTITLTTGVVNADSEYLRSTYLDDNLPPGDYVYYEVRDSGCGMTEETQLKLFDPFFSTKFTGRGLGLAALLGIVRGHHGTVKIHSEAGKGTTFQVLFPAVNIAPVANSVNGVSSGVLATDVQELDVNGSPAANSIDVSAVAAAIR